MHHLIKSLIISALGFTQPVIKIPYILYKDFLNT